jgi:hypothetical protein
MPTLPNSNLAKKSANLAKCKLTPMTDITPDELLTEKGD